MKQLSPATLAPRGLSRAEVLERLERGEVNRPPDAGWADYRAIVVRNVVTLFNALVVPAAIALFLLKELRSAWAVSALALVNTLIGLAQEIRTKHHLDKLAILADPRVSVLRDGATILMTASDVVLGDVVLLHTGDAVVADGVLLQAQFLEVDEALLTGESDPVPRQAGDRLLSGSVCVAGNGVYRVDKVGGASYIHQTSAQARLYKYTPSPMQRTLDRLIGWLTGIAVALCLLYTALYFLRPMDAGDLWQMIAATITSMVPQGLVLMTTVAFTLGAVRMSARGAIVQQLNAVESMASVDVLCMDKTGTLTTGRLSVDQVHVLKGDADEVRAWLRNFAAVSIDAGNKSIQALREHLGALEERQGSPELLGQVPFKSQNRYSAVLIESKGRELALVLGAFERLRALMPRDEASQAEEKWRELLVTGRRLLLFGKVELPPGVMALGATLERCKVEPLALVALSDELRPDAGAILEALASQDIQFKILSGDNPETVKATVAHLRLPLAHEPVASGAEMPVDEGRVAFIEDHSVFGRVAPDQKLDIIRTLQGLGHHVSMIGDGINDILAIKRANLGIAMGAGSSATKTVAALVLENNEFGLLPAALDEGRLILWNLQRAAKLFLLKNNYTLLLIVAGLTIPGLGFPYLPQQVTLLNVLTIGGPALLIMLTRRARRLRIISVRNGFLREVAGFVLGAGVVTAAAALTVWLISAWIIEDDLTTRRTYLLSTLVVIGLGNMLLIAEGDRRLWAWAILALPAYLAIMYMRLTARFFDLAPLEEMQWALIAVTAAAALPVCWLAQRVSSPSPKR